MSKKAAKTAKIYRDYFKNKSADELWKRYSERITKDKPHNIPARQEATNILKTVRAYEHYVKHLEEKFKRELEKTRKELDKAIKEIKRLEKQVQALSAKGAKTPTTQRMTTAAKAARIAKVAGVVDANFKKQDMQRLAQARGDDFAESVGKSTHESKDSYEKVFKHLEGEKQLNFTTNKRAALAASPEFRQAFQDRFSGRMSADEMNDLWERNFGASARPFGSSRNETTKKISWTYKPKK